MATLHRDDRGQSVSVFVMLASVALVIVIGLVVDGGQKVAATRSCESAAAAAARAATDASASDRVSGSAGVSAALLAANASLAGDPEVVGHAVVLPDGRVRVETSATKPTAFLSIVGIDSVTAHGAAEADLLPSN